MSVEIEERRAWWALQHEGRCGRRRCVGRRLALRRLARVLRKLATDLEAEDARRASAPYGIDLDGLLRRVPAPKVPGYVTVTIHAGARVTLDPTTGRVEPAGFTERDEESAEASLSRALHYASAARDAANSAGVWIGTAINATATEGQVRRRAIEDAARACEAVPLSDLTGARVNTQSTASCTIVESQEKRDCLASILLRPFQARSPSSRSPSSRSPSSRSPSSRSP